ncbi:MAG: hypothetical protein LBF90_00780 [Prevotellaceae bacterium]|jgi:hypothetical protein|nr:hypothetical protein [Prevotellaceae bacterium]
MKIIYNSFIPFKGFSAMMLCGVIFARREHRPLSATTINHEAIHRAQARDCGGYLWFYLRYLWFWLRGLVKYRFDNKKAYHSIPFEREAYAYEYRLEYITTCRQTNAWKNFV